MTRTPRSGLMCAVALIGLTALTACSDNNDNPPASVPSPLPAPPASIGEVVATTTSGRVVSFSIADPGTLITSTTISGLASGETLLGIDRRPADGMIYAASSAGRLYTLDPASGVLDFRSTMVAAADDDAPFVALPSGASFGLDFNPVADRLRLVSSDGLDLRINVDTGAVITDGAINGGPAGTAITASAYTNSFAGTRTTTLFAIDAPTGTLFTQNPPNDGTLSAPVALGVTGLAANGFDIDARTNVGYAAFGTADATTLYRIDLAAVSDRSTPLGVVGGGETLSGMAVDVPAAPTAVGLTSDNRLVSFAPAAPGALIANRAVTGLDAGEALIGIDFRPANGMLYGLTRSARIVQIDPATGIASGATSLVPAASDSTEPYAALEGTFFTVDFNPVADRLRVVSDEGQNLRINVETGETISDGAINRASAAMVVGGAYSNSFAGTTTTTLYDLDAASDVMSIQMPPNDGTLVDAGALGIDLMMQTGVDIIGGANGMTLAVVSGNASGPSTLYSVSLLTGAMTPAIPSDASMSLVGGASGPVLIDIALSF